MTKVKKIASIRKDVGVKSSITPCAQSSALCDVLENHALQRFVSIIETFLEKNESSCQAALIGLMYTHGLRVSEVLAISGKDILPGNLIFIKGSKGSENRLVAPFYNVKFWQSLIGTSFLLSSVYSRFWLYREMKKYGLYAYFGNNSYLSVTHSMRHLRVLSLKQHGLELQDLSRFIGHKSFNSIHYYVKEKRG